MGIHCRVVGRLKSRDLPFRQHYWELKAQVVPLRRHEAKVPVTKPSTPNTNVGIRGVQKIPVQKKPVGMIVEIAKSNTTPVKKLVVKPSPFQKTLTSLGAAQHQQIIVLPSNLLLNAS